MKQSDFPKGFLWGASTSSHQVEGNTRNQWTQWEEAHAERLAKNAKKRMERLHTLGMAPKWETIATHALTPSNYLSGEGTAHYQKFGTDFSLLKSLNMNAFRFGIEWSRVEPQEGQWDQGAIDHYRRYIAQLKSLGIEPVLTIWHWTIPIWFADKGGFAKKQNLHNFYAYVAKIAQELGDEVQYIIILNEPNVYSLASYVVGFWPPEKKNVLVGLRVYRNLAEAHKHAYTILKGTTKNTNIGIAMALSQSYAYNERNPINKLTVGLKDYLWNWWFLNRIRKSLDFIGVNFYAADHLDWRLRQKNPSSPHSDLGWYMEPSALFDILVQTTRRYGLPIIVTENGLADGHDTHRKWWIKETIDAMQKALTAGVPLKGYLHWSLLDNFEWAYGWWPKFGLVEVDRTTMKRTVRGSAKWFGKEIQRLRND